MKKRTKGVITYLLRDNFTNSEVMTIQYKKGPWKGYFDIPGAELNNEEQIVETAISSFKNDTGMKIETPSYKGKAIVEYPSEIYEIYIYVTRDYNFLQSPKNFKEHKAKWMRIDKLVFMKNVFPSIDLLNYLFKDQVDIHMELDKHAKYLKVTEK